MHKLITKYKIRSINKYYKKEEERKINQRYIYDEYLKEAFNQIFRFDLDDALVKLSLCLKDKKIDKFIYKLVWHLICVYKEYGWYYVPELHKLRDKCKYDFD